MNWEAFHHRGDVLHTVISELAVRRDGTLPTELPGVNETFRDDLDLVGALQLKWAARLQGWLEREFADQPLNVEAAVIRAWRTTDAELPGVRDVLDAYATHPTSQAMADALQRAIIKERTMLAANAGRLSYLDGEEHGNRIGAEIEGKARDERYVLPAAPVDPVPSLRKRLKAAFAA